MTRFVVKRLLQLVPLLFGITLLSFALMHLAGGDAVTQLLQNQGIAATQGAIDAQRHELGLDRPFVEQYLSWLAGVLSGDMGTSYISGDDVLATFASKLPATLLLAGTSMLVTMALSLPLGIAAAVKKGSTLDRVVCALSFVGTSLPNFLVALLLIYVFAVVLGWFPVISSAAGRTGLSSLSPAGVVLPTATLGIAMASRYTRQVRAAVLDELGKPYVAGARARGVPRRTILTRHVLRSCMVTIVTLMALSVGDLLGGTAIVETIFQWDGVGKLAVDSIVMRDYPLVMAYVMWMAIIYVAVNLIADIVYQRLDPRIHLRGQRA